MLAAALLSAGIGGAASAGSLVNDFFPGVEDFRSQEIRRVQNEKEWPFIAPKGLLMCAFIMKRPVVYFVPEGEDDEYGLPFAISSDILDMAIINIGNTGVLRPYDDFEHLLKRLFPYITMGNRLCDQPAGTELPESSL